jgi:hypothetical protein
VLADASCIFKDVSISTAKRRYLAFDCDIGGWNNILMHFEIMVVLAWLTGRTLVLPPARPFYLLGSQPRTLLDFLDLESLRKYLDVVAAEEFAPESCTHKSFHTRMEEDGHSPDWNAIDDALLHPAGAISIRPELISRLFGRRPIGITSAEVDCDILYFPATKKHRMFGVPEAFFLFSEPENESRSRALIRDAVQFRPEILALVEQAMLTPPLAGQDYSAMHVRRGDFQYEKTRVTGTEILRHTENILPAKQTLYLATDEVDQGFLGPFQDYFRLVRFSDLSADVVAQTPDHWIGIVETLVCAAAPGRFVGTRLSTFSSRIATLRGHLSYGSTRHAGIDSAIFYTQPLLEQARDEEARPYSTPVRKHADDYGETSMPWWRSITREPVWGRAYEVTWASAGDSDPIRPVS